MVVGIGLKTAGVKMQNWVGALFVAALVTTFVIFGTYIIAWSMV